jgi:integrase
MKGHIPERSPGHWYAVLDLRDATTGKRKRKWFSLPGCKGKREAQIACAKLIAEVQGGTYLEPNKITVATYLETWLGHIKPNVSPRTFERYTEIIRKNTAPVLGATLLGQLQPMQISSCYATALSSGRRNGRGGLSPNTVVYMHRVLRQELSDAVRWQILARNPADAISPPRVERPCLTTYDLLQTAELLERVRGTRMLIPVLFGALCGLRRGEIVALRWANVDLTNGQLAIVESAEQTRAGIGPIGYSRRRSYCVSASARMPLRSFTRAKMVSRFSREA